MFLLEKDAEPKATNKIFLVLVFFPLHARSLFV